MNLSPTSATDGRHIGHRRGRSSAIDIRISDAGEPQEKASQPLLNDNDEKYYREPVSPLLPRPRNRRTTTIFVISWMSSLVLVSALTFFLTRSTMSSSSLGSLETGYRTELRAARSAIRVREQRFYGGLEFKGHRGFIPADDPGLKYIGPGPDIDAAWEELTKDRYFLLSDEEAEESYGVDRNKYWNVHHGGWIAGLDVLHSLHCVNHLRMWLYPKTYPHDPVDGITHQAHCIDYLRQLLMCNADLTPVPTQYYAELERNYINASQVHTCRDFSRVRDWATERFNGSTAIKPRNRDGSPRAAFYAPWGP